MNTLATAIGLALLGQVTGGSGASEPAPEAVQVQSIWDFVTKGGLMMVPLGICSLVALAVFIERVVSLRRRNVIPSGFLPGLKEVLKDGSDDRAAAVEYCESDGSPLASVFLAGVKRLGQPVALLEKHVQEAGEREVLKLRKYLRVLALIAAIAPLMGLLGTIFGMINAFQTVAVSGQALGKTELLAKGIYEALITTAAGLLITIPVLIAYHWISAKIERLVSDMDQMAVEFIEEYAAPPSERPRLGLKLKTAGADEPRETVAAGTS